MMDLFMGVLALKTLTLARNNDNAPAATGSAVTPDTDQQISCPQCAEPDMLYGMCLVCGYRSPR